MIVSQYFGIEEYPEQLVRRIIRHRLRKNADEGRYLMIREIAELESVPESDVRRIILKTAPLWRRAMRDSFRAARKGSVKKSAGKEWLKSLLQATALPVFYNIGLFGKYDKKLILFADSNTDALPADMQPLFDELKRRGFRCEVCCRDVSRAGVVGTLKYMCGFMLKYARARGVVVCNYFLPVNACKKLRRTRVVQLWHSCGAFKKFGYSTPNDVSRHFKGSVSANFDVVTVSSPACIPAFEEAFRLKKGTARAVGVCRTDVFFDKEYEAACRKKLYANYPELREKKLLLYLPTFRGDPSHAASTGHEAIERLSAELDGWFTAVRLHPRVKNGRTDLPELTTNELLVCADMLITDYSSAVFEYALLERPMLLWCPDLAEYTAERDFYLDITRDMPCAVVTDESELKNAVLRESEGFDRERYRAFKEKYMSACDGNSVKRVADLLDCHGKER